MKKLIALVCLLTVAVLGQAQISALTESGDKVILYDDGTWEYADQRNEELKEITENPAKFTKGKNSGFLVKSKKMKVGVWLDSKKWRFEKAESTEPAEFQFNLKNEDLYGMLITEKIEIPLERLQSIAIQNAREAASDIKVLNEEYRTVNGTKVLMMQMSGTIQGIQFTYYGYYYSNKEGSVQFITYTSKSLFEDYKNEIEELLNGFVVTTE